MSRGDDVLSQADALMQRHRSFVARPNLEIQQVTENPAGSDITDIPLLTEVVEVDSVSNEDRQLDAKLELALEDWLNNTLPQHIEQVTAQIHQRLLTSLAEDVRASLRSCLETALEDRRAQE